MIEMKCPNKSSKEWKYLVNKLGEKEAYKFFIANNSEVPSIDGINQYLLNKKLISWGASYGITTEILDNLDDRLDKGITAVADILNKTILVSKDKLDTAVLTEEISHFAIELLGYNHPLVERMEQLMLKDDYYKTYLGDKYWDYKKLYNGNEATIIKEAMGQLLSDVIIKQNNNIQVPSRLSQIIDLIWNKFKIIFKKVDINDFHKEIEDVYGKTAQMILSEDLSQFDANNLAKSTTSKFYNVDEIKENNALKKILSDAIESTNKRMKVYEAKDLDTFAQREKATLDKLIKKMDEEKYLQGIVFFASTAHDRLATIEKRVREIKIDLQDLDNVNLKEASKTLRDMNNYVRAYTPILKEINMELNKIRIDTGFNNPRINNHIDNLIRTSETVEAQYYSLSTKVFAKFLSPFKGNNNINIEETLKRADKDISFWQRYLDSMASTSDDVLKLIDISVKNAKEDARFEALEIQKQLLEAKLKLEQAGIKDTKWMYEVDNKGNLTGNIVSKYKIEEFNKDKAQFFHELERKKLTKKEKNKQIAEWFKIHTQKDQSVIDEIARQKEALSEEDFKDWKENYLENNSLTIPSNQYLNKQYSDIINNPVKKEFYDLVISTKTKLDKKLPIRYRKSNQAPQIRKDFVERIKHINNTQLAKGLITESLKDTFVQREDEDERGSTYKITDDRGNLINFLPVYYTNKLNNMRDLSTDIVSTLSSYAMMATDYGQMNKIVDILELGKDVIKQREIVKTDEQGKPIVDKIKILGNNVENAVTKRGEHSRMFDRLEDYYNMVVYGQYKKEEGSIFSYKESISEDSFNKLDDKEKEKYTKTTKPNGKIVYTRKVGIDKAKVLDFLGKYTAINNLGLNVYAGIANLNLGNAVTRIEAITGQFFNNKDLAHAEKSYASNLPNKLAEQGKRLKTNKLDLWMEHMDVLEDFKVNTKTLNADRKGLFQRNLETSSLFFINHAGEHYIQGKISLALASSVKLKDSNGKEISLFDAHEVKNNRLVLKEGITKQDGSQWTQDDTKKFIRKLHKVNQDLHGIYNDIDKSALQQYSLGRLALMFRKFMRPGINKRFSSMRYDYQLDQNFEGYYRTTWNFMGNLITDLKQGQFSLTKNWNILNDTEKANIIRTATEAAYMLAAGTLAMILSNITGDDDDNWALNMTAYQINRLYTELRFYSSPSEAFRILQSPAAGIDQLQRIVDFIDITNVVNWGEEIERGRYKGYTKFHRQAIRVIPLYKSISDMASPEEKLKFFISK